MPHDDPFTLDLFGNTALSSGLCVGVTAFSTSSADSPVDDDPSPVSPAPAMPIGAAALPARAHQVDKGENFKLAATRGLGTSWRDRARDNLAAIRLAADIVDQQRFATPEEQAALIRFTGFGASALANGVFRRPGEQTFRQGWEKIAADLEEAVDSRDYASLARCTQYAHFTPEYIIRAIWAGLRRLGFRGGSVLEPGVGTGLFPALMPEALRAASHVTGIEIDPVTARIACLLQPNARILNQDFARVDLAEHFDLAVGNPPFSDRIVRSDPAYRSHGFRLHDYFIAKAVSRLKPGALAAFVTSSGTMDKADARARKHIATMADLVAAVRLPEGSFRADAGTDVVVDILFFRRRKHGEPEGDVSWLDLEDVQPATEDESAIRVNRWFAMHPDMVLGEHARRRGIYGPDETYTCLPHAGTDLDAALTAVVHLLPEAIYDGEPEEIGADAGEHVEAPARNAADGATIREGSYFIGQNTALMQMVDGEPVTIQIRKGVTGDGIPEKHVRILRKLVPIRDAVREVLKAQEFDRPWKPAQVRLRIAWSSFVRAFGPINFTTVSTAQDEETGDVRETHRRPNIQPFLDDPDCWLVASIEDYDLETNTAKPGPLFTERVIAPPLVPGGDGKHFLATGWRIARPIAEWRRDDFYGHAGQLADEATFRAKVLKQAEHRCEKFALGRREERSSASTPWGSSQGATVYADGVVLHSAAGHGGFLLSPERNRKVHRSLRVDGGAYEEDEAWAIVALTFPHLFTSFERRCANRTMKDSFPDAWETIAGNVLGTGESWRKDERSFFDEHADDWIVVSAILSGHQSGFTEVIATPGGKRGHGTEERRFLVPSDEYRVGPFGFIIDPQRHAVYGGPSSFVSWQGRAV